MQPPIACTLFPVTPRVHLAMMIVEPDTRVQDVECLMDAVNAVIACQQTLAWYDASATWRVLLQPLNAMFLGAFACVTVQDLCLWFLPYCRHDQPFGGTNAHVLNRISRCALIVVHGSCVPQLTALFLSHQTLLAEFTDKLHEYVLVMKYAGYLIFAELSLHCVRC